MTVRDVLVLVLVLFLLCVSACGVEADRFVLRDASYRAIATQRTPPVFTEVPPTERYRIVGIIELRRSVDVPMADVSASAAAAGARAGCDVVVWSKLAPPTAFEPRFDDSLRLVHGADDVDRGHGNETNEEASRPEHLYRFRCGKLVPAATTPA